MNFAIKTKQKIENDSKIDPDVLNTIEALVASHSMNQMKTNSFIVKDIAHESLQDLFKLSNYIKKICSHLSKNEDSFSIEYIQDFSNLIESLTLFTETIQCAKEIFKIKKIKEINSLENELLNILKKILENKSDFSKDKSNYVFETTLPQHMDLWINSGLPKLVRSQDC